MSRAGKRRAARERERLKLTPKALRKYLSFRECSPGLKAIVRATESDFVDVVSDLAAGGGIEDLPAAKRLLVDQAMQTMVASRVLFGMFVETRDPDLASRMATQATTLHRTLAVLGLERRERELNLQDYLRSRDAELDTERGNAPAPESGGCDVE